jgi:hypothetical protein
MCKQLTEQLRRGSRDDKALKATVRRCDACERKFATRSHYEAIVAFQCGGGPAREHFETEWLRDKRALWRFLDDVFQRHKDFKNPKSVRHRSVLIHQLLGSQSFRDGCKKRKTTPMGEIVALLIRQGGAKPEDAGNLYSSLRAQKSRELSRSQAKQSQIHVTIR